MNQGARPWFQCYHNTKLPVATFVHLDDVDEAAHESKFASFTEEPPFANSTLIDSRLHSQTDPCIHQTSFFENPVRGQFHGTSLPHITVIPHGMSEQCVSYDIGHESHIPRIPPSQTTFTIPGISNVTNKSIQIKHNHEEDLFGMIKLRDNDVCYTSGTIEWVGRKRSYPLNSGFKVIEESGDLSHSHQKKWRKLNKTFTSDVHHGKECDCADVLPTVNAIVDHLNALHEAVDLVDLRLNTLEDVNT